jgi:HK97 family phage portal protein
MLNNLFESRAITYQTLFANGEDAEISTSAGTIINNDTAFKINAVFSAISLISDTISTLPVDCFIRRDGARFPFRPKPMWVGKPDIDVTSIAFWGSNVISLLLNGNVYTRIFRDKNGAIVNMTVLDPTAVTVRRNAIGKVIYSYNGQQIPTKDMIHVPDIVRPGEIVGVSRIESLKENWGLALAIEQYAARFFGQGSSTSGIIEVPGNLTPTQAKELGESFDKGHKSFKKAHKTGVIWGGAKYSKTSVDNDAAQFIESRRMAVEDVARAFNIPTHLLGLPGTNTYSSVEQNNIAFVVHTLRPIVEKLEAAYSELLTEIPGGQQAFLKFNLDGLLRADVQARMQAYSIGLQAGFLTINDVRRLEDLTPQSDATADQVRVPLANINLSAANLTEQEGKVKMVQQLVQSGFDPNSVLEALNFPPMIHKGVSSQPTSVDPKSGYGV